MMHTIIDFFFQKTENWEFLHKQHNIEKPCFGIWRGKALHNASQLHDGGCYKQQKGKTTVVTGKKEAEVKRWIE